MRPNHWRPRLRVELLTWRYSSAVSFFIASANLLFLLKELEKESVN